MKSLSLKLLDLYFNDEFYGWGFSLFKIEYEMNIHSLLEFSIRFPALKSGERKIKFDFLFLISYLELYYDTLIDKSFYNKNRLTKTETITLDILNYIYK